MNELSRTIIRFNKAKKKMKKKVGYQIDEQHIKKTKRKDKKILWKRKKFQQ